MQWSESPLALGHRGAYAGRQPPLDTKPRRTAALEQLASLAIEYLEPLGAVVELSGTSLKIDGIETRVAGDPSATLDAIGLQKYGSEMERLAKLEIIDQVKSTESRFTPYGLEILQSSKQAALIKVSHASLRDGTEPLIPGNYLVGDGLHWDELRRELGGPSLAAVLSDLPDSASADDRSSAASASRRIRNERSSGWDLDVLIRGDQTGDKVIFSPVSARGTIEVPFQFSTIRGDTVRGALRLTTPEGILAIAIIRRPDNDELLTRAWVFALRAFADLTCAPEPASADARETRLQPKLTDSEARTSSDRVRQPARIPRSRSSASSSRPHLSGRLTPAASTASVLAGGHYVAGHDAARVGTACK